MLSYEVCTFLLPLHCPSLFLHLRQVQNAIHDIGGIDLGVEIEVAVDVRRRAHVAVTEPFLDLLHRHAVGK